MYLHYIYNVSSQYCPSAYWLGGTPEHAPIWDYFTFLKHSDLKLRGEPKIFEYFKKKNEFFLMGEKNFQNPLLNFLVFLEFTSLRVFASKTLNEVKLRFHYFWPWFFDPLKLFFVFEKFPNIFSPRRSLMLECLRNVKKSQIEGDFIK